jgi:Cu(I)/Ag(I) efflux system protein CusF
MKLGMGWALLAALGFGLAACDAGTPGARQADAPTADSTTPAEPARGTGVIEAVNTAAGTVTIAHQPIEALGWPAMTMSFKVANPELLKRATVGEKVEFSLGGREMSSPITSLEPAR